MGNPGKTNLNRGSILPVLSRWGWAQENPNRIRSFITVKVEPSFVFKVIKLAFAGSIKIPVPGELLNENPLWKHCFQGILSIFEVVKGYAHIDVVSRMFHDVVHQGTPNPAKSQVDSGRYKGLGTQPL